MKATLFLAVVLVIGFLAALVYSSFGNRAFRCEVCITFQGRTSCRIGAASTREHALRTAADLACAQISAGISETTRCPNTPPDSVKWLPGK